MLRRRGSAMIVSAATALWLGAIIGGPAGQEAPALRPAGPDTATAGSPGQDAAAARNLADFLKAQAERSEKAVQATADSVRAYAELLRDEAVRSEKATKDEIETTERIFAKFAWFVQLYGGILTALGVAVGTLLAFFGVRRIRDVTGRAETASQQFHTRVEGLGTELRTRTKEINEEFTRARAELDGIRRDYHSEADKAGTELRGDLQTRVAEFNVEVASVREGLTRLATELRGDLQTRAAEFNVDFASVRDDLTKLTSDLVSRRAAPAPISGGAETPAADYQGKSVIWVDNQPDTTLTARQELENRGITTTPVSATDTLEKMLANPPHGRQFDLIVSDMRRGGNRRAGLDYFKTIKGRGFPKRLIFAPASLVEPVRGEIRQLQEDDDRFLGAVTSTETFFSTVLDVLRRA